MEQSHRFLNPKSHFLMFRRFLALFLIAASGLTFAATPTPAPAPAPPEVPAIKIEATPSLADFAKDIVTPLREHGIEVKLVQEMGNTQVIAALGTGEIDAALLTRSIKTEERAEYPARQFVEITLGTHAVAMVVSRLVWESGMRALTRDQIINLYERKVRNWKDLGGEDRPLNFFEPAHERGPWEIFAMWLYGDTRKAPGVQWQPVADGPDTQTALQFSSGAISVASLRWIDHRDVFPLAVSDGSGKPIEPTKANIASGIYPLMRPVILALADEPATKKKKLVEFLLSDKGQEIVTAHDFVSQAALKAPEAPKEAP